MALRLLLELPWADLRTVAVLTEALAELDRAYLDRFPRTPALYASGVRWEAPDTRTIPGGQLYRSAPVVLAAGEGHCGELSAWRVAELRREGREDAAPLPILAPPMPDGTQLIHVGVVFDGRWEDPSVRLGMPPVPRDQIQRAVDAARAYARPMCRGGWR